MLMRLNVPLLTSAFCLLHLFACDLPLGGGTDGEGDGGGEGEGEGEGGRTLSKPGTLASEPMWSEV